MFRRKRKTVSGSPVVVEGCRDELLALIANQNVENLEDIPKVGGVAEILQEVLISMNRIVNSASYKLNTGKLYMISYLKTPGAVALAIFL